MIPGSRSKHEAEARFVVGHAAASAWFDAVVEVAEVDFGEGRSAWVALAIVACPPAEFAGLWRSCSWPGDLRLGVFLDDGRIGQAAVLGSRLVTGPVDDFVELSLAGLTALAPPATVCGRGIVP